MNASVFDPIDAIMAVMEAAFDPVYGEAWTRRQVSDALIVSNTHYLLGGDSEQEPTTVADTGGFLLSRHGADEEELLLLAVAPQMRRRGIASSLIARFASEAANRGVKRLFLQMREGNPAESVYRANGFLPVGRRRDYYRGPNGCRIDAITFVREI